MPKGTASGFVIRMGYSRTHSKDAIVGISGSPYLVIRHIIEKRLVWRVRLVVALAGPGSSRGWLASLAICFECIRYVVELVMERLIDREGTVPNRSC